SQGCQAIGIRGPRQFRLEAVHGTEQLHFLGDAAGALQDRVRHSQVGRQLEIALEVDGAAPWKVIELPVAHRLADAPVGESVEHVQSLTVLPGNSELRSQKSEVRSQN